MSFAVVVLAAGKGTRMKSALPKVLHPLLGRPLVEYAARAALDAGAERVVVVVGHGAEEVSAALEPLGVRTALQAEQLGTAHALASAREALSDWEGPVVVTMGDAPLISAGTLAGLAQAVPTGGGMAMLTFEPDDPAQYGRVIRDAAGRVDRVVEYKDASPEERAVREVNAGVYAFDAHVWDYLSEIGRDNAAGEYYLPDLIGVYQQHGLEVRAFKASDPTELLAVNDRAQLAAVERVLLERLRARWMREGVRMVMPETIYLEPTVELAPDVTLEPGVMLKGATRVGAGVSVGAFSIVSDSELAPGAEVRPHSVLEGARLAAGAVAGPFARLRPGAVLEANAFVGNFVEVKKSRLGPGVKAGHLAYLGDAEVGAGTNVGAGTITANYDGVKKHPTIIGPRAFIGSNSVLIAPVRIGAEATVAAGSAINQDVPAGALGIARARQRNLEGWAERKARASNSQKDGTRMEGETT
ncbi:bifunctional UDP-N-acetylglucosamine diphosphorylase/glucosamine-1-phosphate N-acetyltransferase GlmU [Oceanithermus sp.]|uniref:bifunctional UDP-N-acetylglucosamine diphosphorylase/glucosamine-1-phosphate N-acetyltransferase GlmU n=1 Tax=Oceanithermus sp. TaxID=2268145 RepID=UPI00257E8EA6|nr:bifunctional UDP-N-acetylglucosamine diphosphorylase/glucosamine-1-phosphate N-acetyltransferase GlmU [Oceanithermus sp.]